MPILHVYGVRTTHHAVIFYADAYVFFTDAALLNIILLLFMHLHGTMATAADVPLA